MLVLKRTVGERIIIGDGIHSPRIVITLVETGRYTARLGVDAPREVPVFREELLPLDDPREGQ